MITAKKFTKEITKMFNKKSVLRNTKGIVADGYILYRGDLWKDVFYRLRLEMDGQMELLEDVLEGVFKKDGYFQEVNLEFLYTLCFEGGDIYEVTTEKGGESMYICFDPKYRKLFLEGVETTYTLNTNNLDKDRHKTLTSGVHIECDFGEVFVMPMSKELDKIYYKR